MSHVAHTWAGSDYSAIRISAARGNIEVEGSPDDRISIENDLDGHAARDISIRSGGTWLVFDLLRYHGDAKLKLHLPLAQTWFTRISAARGDIKIKQLRGRSQIMLGRGNLTIDHFEGELTAMTGRADIKIKHFDELKVPAMPDVPHEFENYAQLREPNRADILDDWESWGEEMGGRLRAWVLNSEHFLGPGANQTPGCGLNLHTVRGQIEIDDTSFLGCSAGSMRGDLKIKNGLSGRLEAEIHRGDLEIQTLLDGGDWRLKTSRGNIRLELDNQPPVRLDLATRDGDIKTEIPLVKVSRQGPCGFHSNRMVGTLGQDRGGSMAELHLTTVHGDIVIKAHPANRPQKEETPTQAETPPLRPDVTNSANSEKERQPYRTSLEVLQALSQKLINIEEADRIIKELQAK